MSAWPYNTGRWRRIRARQLAREPMCQACALEGKATPAEHVDHRTPISAGGEVWSMENLQSLCPPHHSLKTHAYDKQGKDWMQWERRGCDVNGMPLDPDHPWHSG